MTAPSDGAAASTVVVVPPLPARQTVTWSALLEIADSLGDHWSLVGGQMVLLHQLERRHAVGGSLDLRLSGDIDVIVNLRVGRSQLVRADTALRAAGFEQPVETGGHRYRRSADGAQIDVLAPDHLGPRRPLLGTGATVQIPGGTQALKRTEAVTVQHAGVTGRVLRPNLVGALLGKLEACSLPRRTTDPPHWHDACLLASMIEPSDCDGVPVQVTASERRLLRSAAKRLNAADNSDSPAAAGIGRLLRATSRSATETPRRLRRNDKPAPDAAKPVACRQKLVGKRTCRRRLMFSACPYHPASLGSREVNRRNAETAAHAAAHAAEGLEGAS